MQAKQKKIGTSKKPLRWKICDNVIYFTVVSNGMTGLEWDRVFKEPNDWPENYRNPKIIKSHAGRMVLRSKKFRPSKKGTRYRVAVLTYNLFNKERRRDKDILAAARHRGFRRPRAELGCLIRVRVSDETLRAMGLRWIVVMHKPVRSYPGSHVAEGCSARLGASRGDGGKNDFGNHLRGYESKSPGGWGDGSGYAFIVPRKKKKLVR